MRDASQRCSRWRRIRIASCSRRSGNRIGMNRMDNCPPTTRASKVDSSLCSGPVGVWCTCSVTVLAMAKVPSAIGSGATGSKDELGVGVVMAAMVLGSAPTFNVGNSGSLT